MPGDDASSTFLSTTYFLHNKWPVDPSGKTTCGCAVPREIWLARENQGAVVVCPLCGRIDHKIVAVLDGFAHSKLATDPENDHEENKGNPLIVFKHGSLNYVVGVPDQQPAKITSSFRPFFGWSETAYGAVHHLAYVLGLELSETKILCKGKVLYPSPSSSPSSLQNISERLIQESAGPLKAPRLLVMGTPRKQQLRPSRSSDHSTSQWIWMWFGFWLWWPYQLLEPYLPKWLRLTSKKD